MPRGWLVLGGLLSLLSVSVSAAVEPAAKRVIAYGKDLTSEERIVVFREFPLPEDINPEDLKSVEVSNEEEWQMLKDLVPADQIGTKAISSAYLEQLTNGTGLQVETHNLSFVTPLMFANVLATAGVKDVMVYATAPQEVSGTAALTGIYKAIESLTGKTLDPEAKQVAAEELIQTGRLGETVGKEQAALLLGRTKEHVVKSDIDNVEAIRRIVDDTAKKQNIVLTEEERQELATLLSKIKKLNLNGETLQRQLKNFQPSQEEVSTPEESGSWLDRLIEFFRSLFNQLFSFVGQIFG